MYALFSAEDPITIIYADDTVLMAVSYTQCESIRILQEHLDSGVANAKFENKTETSEIS